MALLRVVQSPFEATVVTLDLKAAMAAMLPHDVYLPCVHVDEKNERWSWFIYSPEQDHWYCADRLYHQGRQRRHPAPVLRQRRNAYRRHKRTRRLRPLPRRMANVLLYVGGKHTRTLRQDAACKRRDEHRSWLEAVFRQILEQILLGGTLPDLM